MRWFVVPAVGLQACCVPLPFPHDHDDHTTDSISVDDDGGPPRDTSLPPVGDTSDVVDCPEGLYGGHTIVMAGDVDCIGDRARLDAELLGWSDHVVVFLQETGAPEGPQWSEEHPLDTFTRDDCGFDEDRKQILEPLGVSVEDWQPGVSSVFDCATHLSNPDRLTVAIYVEDIDDGAGDCFAFGHDAAGLVAGMYDEARIGEAPTFDLSQCAFAR